MCIRDSDWADLIGDRPAGTARAYYRHEATRDLLARPGEQDLTCHVCWAVSYTHLDVYKRQGVG